jgi:hypothetical protein
VEGCFFFWGIQFFSLTKAGNHSFRNSIAWLGVCKGLGLKANTKIHNLQQNVGLFLVVGG